MNRWAECVRIHARSTAGSCQKTWPVTPVVITRHSTRQGRKVLHAHLPALRALKNFSFGLSLGAAVPLVFARLFHEEALLFALHFDQGLPSLAAIRARQAHTRSRERRCAGNADVQGEALHRDKT